MKIISSLILAGSLAFGSVHSQEQSIPFSNNNTEARKEIPAPSNCPASPFELIVNQPNNTTISVLGKGNMSTSWTETTDGYTIVPVNGIYEYAKKINGDLIGTGVKANNPSNRNTIETSYLTSIQKSIKPDFDPLKNSILSQVNAQLSNKTFPTTGNIKVLTLLIDYPDLNNTYPKSNFDSLLYGSNYRSGDGSFKTYYETSSNGIITVDVDVVGWYRAANNYAYYSRDSGYDKAADLVREAVDAAELAGVNFANYDNDNDGDVDGILTVHAGPGAESGNQTQFIWSHRWVMNGGNLGSVTYDGKFINDYMMNPETRGSIAVPRMVGIGVFCHEFGHNLGLPDLYDTDDSNGDSEGIGNWCLMAGGGWLGGEHRPINFSAWCRLENNWDTPTLLNIGGSSSHSMSPASTTQNEIFRVNTGVASEYFLLENRQKTGLDLELPGTGLAVWHINTTKTNSSGNGVNADENLKGVDLEEADGNNDLDNEVNRGDGGDLFPGTSNVTTFDDNSNPNARNYSLATTGLELRNIAEVGNTLNFDFGPFIAASCSGGTTVITSATGTFEDGSGPTNNYTNNLNCSWLIQPTNASSIILDFSRIDVDNTIDRVAIYDGVDFTAPLLATFTGNIIPTVSTISTGGAMYVEFTTNGSNTGLGWGVSYSSTTTSASCSGGTTTLTAASGTFSDGSGPNQYANNLNCSWLIQPAGATSITFGLNSLATEISTDIIRIYDGPNNSAPLLASYSGTNNLNTATSTGGSVFVEFITNGSVVDAGWDAFYSSSTTGPGCSGSTTFTSNSGSFSDGSGLNNYDNNQFCSWLIQPNNGPITLNFTAFDTEVTNDRVLVFDGPDNLSPQIGNFSGTSIPVNLVSTSNSMYLEFRTNGSLVSTGWDANYSTASTPCSGNTTLTAASGSFSDGSGASNYGNNLSCSWLIQPVGASTITFGLSSLATEISTDFVRVYDGTNNTAPLLASYSGTNNLNTATSSGGSIFVEFITNGSGVDAGWDAYYTSSSTGPSCSGTTTLTTLNGSFSDGSGVNNYDNNQFCSWLIQPNNGPITLNFTAFDTEATNDRVLVFDGPDNLSPQIGNFSGTSIPGNLVSTSNSMYLEFRTNGSIVSTGWDANYSTASPSCSGTTTLTNTTGNFDDGSGPNIDYLDNLDCNWLIDLPASNVIRIEFDSLNLSANDSVYLYDGNSTASLLIGKYSGSAVPAFITTSGNTAFVNFKTDGNGTDKGWQISYNGINGCVGSTVFTATSGTFTDGSLPTVDYLDNQSCDWLIQPPGATFITIDFNRFFTEPNFDFVTIYDGASNTSPLLGTFSGNAIPPSITSSGGVMFVEFASDQLINELGWEATYIASFTTCTQNNLLNALTGSFSDGSGTSNYSDNSNCNWLIQPASATSITLTFPTFNTEMTNDVVNVYDGIDNTGTLIGSYSGSSIPTVPTITGTNKSMFVEFISDATNTFSGWDATYTAISTLTCSGTTNLTAPSGSFDDGSGASQYSNNLNCSWLIQPTGNPISITFTMNNISTANFRDIVRVYDGIDNTGALIGFYFGTNTQNPVTAFSGSMFVEFITSGVNQGAGWDASYVSANTYCDPNSILTANNGAFTDGSPNGTDYLDNTDCEWLIQPGIPNTAISLGFSRFNTEANFDSVTVYDGATTAAPILISYSGNLGAIPAIVSTGGSVLVKFESDGSQVRNGWRATYNTQAIPACSGTTNLTATSGTFDDGSGNGSNYVSNSNCQWLIQPTGGAVTIDLSFNYFTTQNNADVVSVYDGATNTSTLLGSFSGNTIPASLTATSGSMLVEFTSNQNFNANGFEATYTSSNVIILDAQVDTVYINAASGSTGSFLVNSNTNWNATDNAAWLIVTPINGSQSQTVNLLAIQPNIGPERYARVIINTVPTNLSDTVIVAQRTSGNFMDISPTSLNFIDNPIASQPATVSSSVNWTATPSAAWITATPLTGNGNGTVQISASQNLVTTIRSGMVVFSGNLGVSNDTVFITQDAAPTPTPTLSVSPKNISMSQPSGSMDIFTVNSTVNWQTSTPATWLTITNPTNTFDTNTVMIAANSANTLLNTRSTFVAVQDAAGTLFDTVFVDQLGLNPTLITNPDTLRLAALNGSNAIGTVTSNLTWNLLTSAAWFSSSALTGTSNANLTFTALSDNNTGAERIAEAQFSTGANNLFDTIVIVQDFIPSGGVTTNPDTIRIASTNGSTNSFNVNAGTITQWTSNPTDPWIGLSSTSGTGSQSITVTANSDNPNSSERITYIVTSEISLPIPDTVVVVQDGSNTVFNVSPNVINLGFAIGSSDNFNISSNVNWTITNPVTWLSLNQISGSNNGVISATTNSDNLTGSSRSATLVVSSIGLTDLFVTVTQIDGSVPIFEFSKDTVFVNNSQGSTSIFSVLSNTLNWSLTENTSWLLVNPISGDNTETITVLVASRNSFGSDRSAKIKGSALGFPDDSLIVIQKGATPLFQVAPNAIMLGSDSADNSSFNISSNLTNWSVSESSSWMEVSITSGSFTQNVVVTAIDSNTTNSQRTDVITVSSPPLVPRIVSVTQDTAIAIGINSSKILEAKVSIYPNPTNGIVTVELEGNSHQTNFHLYDMFGKEMELKTVYQSNNKTVIDMNHFSVGVYFLRVINNGKVISKKITLIE